MLRTTLAAVALVAVMAATSFAGDCLSCGGYGGQMGYRSGMARASWDGYCGDGCNDCGGGCGACDRCCFPLVHCTLHKIGRVFDCLLPDPCCRPKCGYPAATVGCCQPTCGADVGYGVPVPAADPFIDDAPAPTPMPTKDARSRSVLGNQRVTYAPAPTPSARPTATKSVVKSPAPVARPKVTAKSSGKTAAGSKAMGKTVLKVAYEEETSAAYSIEDTDAPPVAPASIRNATRQVEDARVVAKPIVKAPQAEMPANPLR